MTALTTTVNAETVYGTPVTLQSSVSTAPLQSPSPTPSITAAPTFVSIPAPHTTTLSPAAKSGIAISVSVAATILISALALLWRKRRSVETKRRNDLEAKAIWVTRSFVVETEAGSTGGESTDGLRNGGVIPANWTTVPSEKAKVVKRWSYGYVIEGLTRWPKTRKGVHRLRAWRERRVNQ
jgi:hypothetical protein